MVDKSLLMKYGVIPECLQTPVQRVGIPQTHDNSLVSGGVNNLQTLQIEIRQLFPIVVFVS